MILEPPLLEVTSGPGFSFGCIEPENPIFMITG